MGNVCDCLNAKGSDSPSAKTPLLSGHNSQPDAAPKPVTVTHQPPTLSARQHKPEDREFETSLDALAPINLIPVPTMPSINKTFQDHAKLYNDMYTNFVELKKCIHDFKSQFVADTAGIPVMSECLRLLAQRCGGITLQGTRSKNCIQIQYDPKQISRVCKGPPEEVLDTLELYNKANKLIRSILDKSHLVQSSINLILEEEEKLKREVLKADPDGKLGPEPLRLTSENLTKMHMLPERIDTMHKYTSRSFKEISEGSKSLFQEADS